MEQELDLVRVKELELVDSELELVDLVQVMEQLLVKMS